MKKILNVTAIVFGLIICKPAFSQVDYYGKKIDEQGAVSMKELVEKMGEQKSMPVKVTGKVAEVCQDMGCWLTLEKGDGTNMHVRMKGHSFFVPKNSSGKTAVIEGIASIKTISVEELKDNAAEAGKSEDVVAEIKEPKTELVFEAEGVILK